MAGLSANAQLSLKCPDSCRPVKACGQCWESTQAASDGGCDDSNARIIENVNNAQSLQSYSIFPNPSIGGSFTLESTQPFSGQLSILNATGKMIAQQNLAFNNYHFLNQGLDQGLYVVIIKSSDGKLTRMKLLVKK